MSAEKHTIYGGKVHIYRRAEAGKWQCSAYIAGKNRRVTTGETSLALAKEFAEDWYLSLKGQVRDGALRNEKSFKDAVRQFKLEYPMLARDRNPRYVQTMMGRIDNYLVPFFGSYGLSQITAGLVQEYRVWRHSYSVPRYNVVNQPDGPPSQSTTRHELVALRQVLKAAQRCGWLDRLPDLSFQFGKPGKIVRRAWFSPEEYKRLYEATRKAAQTYTHPRPLNAALRLHDYVLFMCNTGLRPDEAGRLEYRDVTIVDDADSGETILEIEVNQGKRGFGYCKSMPGAVHPFKRLRARNQPDPTDRIFPVFPGKMFNRILEQENLKFDRSGQRRTAYSLRHTYICMRLMEGADIYQVAKNCRTSVEMIEKYYASHIKSMINAAAINVRRKP